MNLFRIKCLLSEYGSVVVSKQSFLRQEKEMTDFIKENNCGTIEKENYLILSCDNYSISKEEYSSEIDKISGRRKNKDYGQLMITKEEFDRNYKKLIDQIKKRDADARKQMQNNKLSDI